MVNADTTFTATGTGTADSVEVTYPDDPDEQDEVTVDTLSTIVDIDTLTPIVVAGDTVDLTVTEENDGSANLTNVEVLVDDGSGTIATLDETDTHTGDSVDPGVLNHGETWTWTAATVAELNDVPVSGQTIFTASGNAEYDGITVNVGNDPDEEASVTVEDLSTMLSITPDVWETYPGGNVRLTVTEENDGSADLTNVEVLVDDGSGTIATLTAGNVTSGDTGGDGILGAGETWVWDWSTVSALNTWVTGTTMAVSSLTASTIQITLISL